MSVRLAARHDWPLRCAAAVATLVALQPGVTGAAALALVGGVAWLAVRAERAPYAVGWLLGAVLLGAAALQAGLSPALVMAAFVLVVSISPRLEIGTSRWLAPWVAAVALTQLPPVVGWMLSASDAGPPWIGIVIAPWIFLTAAAAGGVLRVRWSLAAALAVVVCGYIPYQLEWNPALQATLAAMPAAVSLIATSAHTATRFLPSAVLIAGGIGASLLALLPAVGPPRPLSVWIPQGETSMSRYFEEYAPVLQASGFRNVRMVGAATDVGPNDWVMLPSAAHPDLGSQLQTLRELPHYASLRIIVIGEHTDAEGIATALEASGSPIGLGFDTTIPPGNADLLGWSSGLGSVPSRSLALNRGASVRARAWDAVPLVWVQGGHREADRSNDGRLGDMVLRRGERAGLYSVLSLGREPDGATWVVLGDSTPALNEFVAADPNGFARILALATGLPGLLGVLSWAALYGVATGVFLRFNRLRLGLALAFIAATEVSAVSIASRLLDASHSKVKLADRVPYGDRAVGRAVVALSRSLLEADVTLEIGKITSGGQGRRVSTGHPDGWWGRLDCVRAGNIAVDEVRVLDVLTCPDAREGAVLSIGADAIAYRRGSHLVVLDQHFLANAAPHANVDWLKARIGEAGR